MNPDHCNYQPGTSVVLRVTGTRLEECMHRDEQGPIKVGWLWCADPLLSQGINPRTPKPFSISKVFSK